MAGIAKVHELAEGWPHKHLGEYPDEIHVQPRTAYFVRDGKVVFVRLETITQEDALAGIRTVEALAR